MCFTIPFILVLMIFYDFSLHALELILGKRKASKLFFWPSFKVKGKFNRKDYTIFWTIYWGIALVLLLIYIKNL